MAKGIIPNNPKEGTGRPGHKPRRKSRPTWIYLIGTMGSVGPVKIGIAANPSRRLFGLQSGSPVPLIIHHAVEVGVTAHDFEHLLHQSLAAKHSHGEWFNITPSAGTALIEQIISKFPRPVRRWVETEKTVLVVGPPVVGTRSKWPRGYKRPWIARRRKLSDDDVRAIRVDPGKLALVAARYGVSETTVYNVRRRLRKAHVSDAGCGEVRVAEPGVWPEWARAPGEDGASTAPAAPG